MTIHYTKAMWDWGSHSGKDDTVTMGCDTMWTHGQTPTFWRNTVSIFRAQDGNSKILCRCTFKFSLALQSHTVCSEYAGTQITGYIHKAFYHDTLAMINWKAVNLLAKKHLTYTTPIWRSSLKQVTFIDLPFTLPFTTTLFFKAMLSTSITQINDFCSPL